MDPVLTSAHETLQLYSLPEQSTTKLLGLLYAPGQCRKSMWCELMSALEQCECCGTDIILVEREDAPTPIWYEPVQQPEYAPTPLIRHDAQRCQEARGPRA